MPLDNSALEIASQVRSGLRSATDVVHRCLDRIKAQNGQINAFTEVWEQTALQQAQGIDEKMASGRTLGPLAGVPIAIKDNLCVAGKICGCASHMLSNYRPTYQATVIDRLIAADAILVGRTNMDEFAMGSSTEYSVHGPTKNPANIKHSPGGSSGGSAAAVASGMVPLALGSDTGGSIRQPAAFCGIYGLKPTYGRVSRYGLIAFASSLDQVGPFANSPADLAIALGVIAGNDRMDATSLPDTEVVDAFAPGNVKDLRGLTIGIIAEHQSDELHSDVKTATNATIQKLKKAGAQIVDVHLPHQPYAIATYYLVASCEAASNLSRYDGMHFGHRSDQSNQSLEDTIRHSRGEGFGEEVKRRIMLGTFALSEGYSDQYYLQALKVRRKISDDFHKAFEQVDVLLGPTTAAPAFEIGQHQSDPVAMYMTDVFTVSANLAGIPAISVPTGIGNSGLPTAVQLQASTCQEKTLLRVASYLREHS